MGSVPPAVALKNFWDYLDQMQLYTRRADVQQSAIYFMDEAIRAIAAMNRSGAECIRESMPYFDTVKADPQWPRLLAACTALGTAYLTAAEAEQAPTLSPARAICAACARLITAGQLSVAQSVLDENGVAVVLRYHQPCAGVAAKTLVSAAYRAYCGRYKRTP